MAKRRRTDPQILKAKREEARARAARAIAEAQIAETKAKMAETRSARGYLETVTSFLELPDASRGDEGGPNYWVIGFLAMALSLQLAVVFLSANEGPDRKAEVMANLPKGMLASLVASWLMAIMDLASRELASAFAKLGIVIIGLYYGGAVVKDLQPYLKEVNR